MAQSITADVIIVGAGALTVKTLNRLRYSVDPVIRYRANHVALANGKTPRYLSKQAEVCALTVRQELDEYCLSQTLEQGATLYQIASIDRITPDHDHVQVTDQHGQTFIGKVLIGADGAHSQVRKLSEHFHLRQPAVALKGIVKRTNIDHSDILFQFDFHKAKYGYGWLFPKDDHINVGLYSYQPQQAALSKAALTDYCEYRLGTRQIEHIVGFPIVTSTERYKPQHRRIVLIGDAAGLAEPLLGEGIHNAIKSTQLIAGYLIDLALLEPNFRKDYSRIMKSVHDDIGLCFDFARHFYHWLPLSYWLGLSRRSRRAILTGCEAGWTMSQMKQAYLGKAVTDTTH